MKTIIKFLLRLTLIPFYLIVALLGVIECSSIILSVFLLGFFYEYLFNIEYDSFITGSKILWKKLEKLKQQINEK